MDGMGLMNTVMNAVNQAAGGAQQAGPTGGGAASAVDPQTLIGMVGELMDKTGGLSALLAQLQSGGLGEAVKSWVGTGANQPVSGEQIGGALGPVLMGLVAQHLGSNPQNAAGTLAQLLPGLVDQLTPQGQVPADNGQSALSGLLGGGGGAQLLGALGSLMGKR
jgi:uncharacterized protein YidB (DUF937 family)